MLRARLLADDPDLVRRLHRCASDWYSAHGPVADAVRHALAAEDFPRAAYLVEEALPEVRRTRQDGLLLGWAAALPESVVSASPVLSMLAGSARMMAGDLDGWESCLDQADAAWEAGARDPDLAAGWADTHDLRTAPATILVFRASLAQARGDLAVTVHHARRAYDRAGTEDHLVRGSAGGFLALAAWAAGDLDEAIGTFTEAVRNLRAAGNLVDELDGTIVLGDLWVGTGRPGRARLLYERALATATAQRAPYPRATADLHVGLAELDLELDDLPGAEAHLATARLMAEHASISENRHRLPLVTARVLAARGDPAAARALLQEAEELYRHGFYPDVRPIAATRARLDITTGDLDAAMRWAGRTGIGVDDDPVYLHEYAYLTLARLLLAQARLREVHRLLDRLHDAAGGRGGSLVEVRVLQALAHHAGGDPDQALEVLGRALADAPEPDAHVRLYLDEGAPMLALLGAASRASDPAGAWARRLLGLARPPAAPVAAALVDPLSPRELDVVRMLASELTGPQIAAELYVSLNTLRTHTKRIFTKLDVRTRAAAVRRAREHGLL